MAHTRGMLVFGVANAGSFPGPVSHHRASTPVPTGVKCFSGPPAKAAKRRVEVFSTREDCFDSARSQPKQSLDVVVESFQILLDDNGILSRSAEQSTLALTLQKGTITSSVLGRRPAWMPTEGLPCVKMKEIYPEGTLQVVDSLA